MDKAGVQHLVRGYSIETTVREAARIARFSDLVPPGTRLYVVHVPGTSFQETIGLAARLRREGVEPVPHVVARHYATFPELDDFLARLSSDAGVRQVLVVAGDQEPSGEVESSLQVFDSGLFEKYGIRTIGIAGHPEGHPSVSEPVLREALRRKNAYAARTGSKLYILTQFVFAAEPVIAWEQAQSEDIGALPVTVGLPGLAAVRTLLKYARDCGIGPSVQALTKRAARLTRLLTVSTPGDIIVKLAEHHRSRPQSQIANVHFFPFGSFKRTAEWANQIAAGNFDLVDDGLQVPSSE